MLNINSGLVLSYAFASLHQILERIVLAVLEQDVHVLTILECFNEFDDVLVLERSVYFYFDQQLVALPFLADGLLGDHFCCVHYLIFVVDGFETLSKASCA